MEFVGKWGEGKLEDIATGFKFNVAAAKAFAHW